MTEKSEKDTEQENKTGANTPETDAKNPAHKLEQADGEIGGPRGLEPTRYGDWERKGIVSDF